MTDPPLTPATPLQQLWSLAGAEPEALNAVVFQNPDGQLPSVFHVGPIAAATIGAQALAAAQTFRHRTGKAQTIEVDVRRALAMFRSERYITVDGAPPVDPMSPLFGYYRTADKKWLQLHTNFPHHRDGVLRVLGCANTRAAVAEAVSDWQGAELDARLAAEGLCAALVRSSEEWNALPQAQAVAQLPLFEIIRIGGGPPQPVGQGSSPMRPLSGVRVLDLSRVIAAPVAGRTLAEHGAQVLAISAAHLPNIQSFVIDTGRGKRTAQLDLRSAQGASDLMGLAKEADVFLQAFRPGALDAFGFAPDRLAAACPGLVYVTLSAYSHAGPWADRRGYDSLVQSATGIAYEEGLAAGLNGPGRLPCQALDHATGHIAAFATMIALQRRAREGGSWMVRVSLAQTGRWLQSFGRRGSDAASEELTDQEVAPWLQTVASAYGLVRAVAPVEQMSLTPAHLELPPSPLGTHDAQWRRDPTQTRSIAEHRQIGP